MGNIKSRAQYIKENYNRPSISDSRRNRSDYERLKDQATQDVVKHSVQKGGFPEGEMNKFIDFIKDKCAGSIVTLRSIEEIVKEMLRVSTENNINTAIGTGNFNIIKVISQLIYDEMKERNLLDLTDESFEDESFEDEDGFDDDLDFNEDDDVDGFQANDEIKESVKRRKPIIRNKRK